MKRLFTMAAVAVLLSGSLSAGATGRNDINVYLGFMNSTFTVMNNNNGASRTDLYSLYEPSYSVTCGPTLALDYNRRLMNWFGVGVQTNYSQLSGTIRYRMGNKQARQFRQHMIAVLPQVKFFIPSPEHFRMYTKLAAGVNFNAGDSVFSAPLTIAWDVVPFGCEWGGQFVYGTAEICVGNVITGVKIGLGFRF